MISHNPLISVVTVVYNGDKYLEQAISSVANQTYDNIEYIIVDGGSTDRTLDIIRKHEHKISFWMSEPDYGIFDAMNKGVQKASGDFIGILNADDWYEPNIIRDVVNKINTTQTSSEQVVIYSDYYDYDEEVSPETKTKKYSRIKRLAGMSICHQAMFINRAVYEKIGLYDLSYSLASDFDFFLRMVNAGVDFVKIDVHGVNFRRGGQSTVHLTQSVKETSRIIRLNYGLFNKVYLIFLIRNWMPSWLGRLKLFLYKYAGRNITNKIRRMRRRLKFNLEDVKK